MDERSPLTAARTAAPPTTPVGPAAPGMTLAPLPVSGLVVSTATLVAALRPYLPQLIEVKPLDGERFLLTLAGVDQEEQSVAVE